MRLQFEKEGDGWFVVAYDEELNGYIHEELLYAEISSVLGGAIKVSWEDSFSNTEFFDTFDIAQKHIRKEYINHTPLSQKKKTYVGEE